MTVKQLIESISEYPDDYEVLYGLNGEYYAIDSVGEDTQWENYDMRKVPFVALT